MMLVKIKKSEISPGFLHLRAGLWNTKKGGDKTCPIGTYMLEKP
jgi:hypothetical protein